MDFDPAVALRMIANSHMRTALGTSEFRDLGGALVVTSDAPIAGLNCVSDFTTTEARLESLLDIGFSLLRIFDRPAAAELSPLDRPTSVAEHLRRRGLDRTGGRAWMIFGGDQRRVERNRDLEIRIVDGDDVQTFATLHGGSEAWVRRLSRSSVLTGLLTPGNTFYLGCIEGMPVATLHLLVDGDMAGLYALGTMRSYRRRGIASTMLARAIDDAHAAKAEVVYLSTDRGTQAQSLYERLGFVRTFDTDVWVEPEPPFEPPTKRRKVRKRAARSPSRS